MLSKEFLELYKNDAYFNQVVSNFLANNKLTYETLDFISDEVQLNLRVVSATQRLNEIIVHSLDNKHYTVHRLANSFLYSGNVTKMEDGIRYLQSLRKVQLSQFPYEVLIGPLNVPV